MIEAAAFVEAARARGFAWWSGVPCSYLTPFIDYVSQADGLHYVSAANEGDAVALVAGATAGANPTKPRGVAMMQNSGLGNAVSPLTSLTWTFRLPQLLIVTWRGQPGVPDEPQHALMGPITPTMLDTMEIPWAVFPTDADAIAPALDRATTSMDATGRPYALVMQKGTVAPFERAPGRREHPRSYGVVRGHSSTACRETTRRDALERVIANTPVDTTVVIASTGYCGRELHAIDDRPNQLYLVGSMGCATTFALGFALARPELTIVALDGDGAALMRMGAFATLGAYGPANLVHILLDNGVHESTGGQATVSASTNFAGIAACCGYASAVDDDDPAAIDRLLTTKASLGPRFLRFRMAPGTPADLPRPTIVPADVAARLMRHVSSSPRAAA